MATVERNLYEMMKIVMIEEPNIQFWFQMKKALFSRWPELLHHQVVANMGPLIFGMVKPPES